MKADTNKDKRHSEFITETDNQTGRYTDRHNEGDKDNYPNRDVQQDRQTSQRDRHLQGHTDKQEKT